MSQTGLGEVAFRLDGLNWTGHGEEDLRSDILLRKDSSGQMGQLTDHQRVTEVKWAIQPV